jgi:hypothetical protein
MKHRAVGLLLRTSLILVLLAAPLAVQSQPAGRIPLMGFLGPGPIADWSSRERLSGRDSVRSATSRTRTSASSGGSRPADMIDCPIWPPSWSSSIPT